ncbi:hypothetical protein [Aminobacter sp. HY435]|uniref:hypothetical protein n=1 Tax=Aminobacter sp. HY435 TaxID=2970917 RepID=UPI0022B9A47E|nr:hypothetical protein [Aminobacter sp. HY435]
MKKAGKARFPLAPETLQAAGTFVVGMPSIRANSAARGKTQGIVSRCAFRSGKLADGLHMGGVVDDIKEIVFAWQRRRAGASFGDALLLSH